MKNYFWFDFTLFDRGGFEHDFKIQKILCKYETLKRFFRLKAYIRLRSDLDLRPEDSKYIRFLSDDVFIKNLK